MSEDKKIIEAFPLSWPIDYPRTKNILRSRFSENLSVARSRDDLLNELRMMRATNIILSSNIPLRKDGLPYSNFRVVDAGVAVYFTYDKQQIVICCDRWIRVQDNIHAIERTINSLRQLARDGVSEMLKRTFTGFKALPEKAGQGNAAWWIVLGLKSDSTIDEIKSSYRKLCLQYHPDHNEGNDEQFLIIRKAYEQAMLGKE